MSKTCPLSLSILFTIPFLFTSLLAQGTSNGLTLELIHRNSPESPHFLENLTTTEQDLKSVQQTLARVNLLAARHSPGTTLNPNAIGANASFQVTNNLMIKVGVGTFSNSTPNYMPYFLAFDTSSSFIWMQCEGCRSCFDQEPLPFPGSRSSTYSLVVCKEEQHLCNATECSSDPCFYNVAYADNSRTIGVMARETFTFNSSDSQRSTLARTLLFGCGLSQFGFTDSNHNNWMAGVMGAGWGETSIVAQLQDRANGRFSYCIPAPPKNNSGVVPSTFVNFGLDIPSRSGFQTTRLLNYGDHSYYTNMLGISLGNQRLPIDSRVFQRNGTSGGTILDVGAEVSVMVSDAFVGISQALALRYHEVPGVKPIEGGMRPWDVCFTMPQMMSIQSMPSITFHLEGGNVVVQPENVYVFGETAENKFFCLAMIKTSAVNMIGAFQQRNHRFTYDTIKQELSFGPEECH